MLRQKVGKSNFLTMKISNRDGIVKEYGGRKNRIFNIWKLIKAPVILVIEGAEKCYGSGEELMTIVFEKNYMVESISARDNKVVVTLKENDRQFNINWIGEEEVSFI